MRRKMATVFLLGLTSFMLTACGSVRFLVHGQEFKKICEDNGFVVEDVLDSASKGFSSMTDAYIATDKDSAVSVLYYAFSDSKESDTAYAVLSRGMEEEKEASFANYRMAVSQTDNTVREIYYSSGKIIYAAGDADAIDKAESTLISDWSGTSVQNSERKD